MIFSIEGAQEIDGQDIEWTADLEGSYRPAQLFGPPERCSEAEGEMDVLALATFPPGYEDKIDEDAVLEAAWEKFHQLRGEGEA